MRKTVIGNQVWKVDSGFNLYIDISAACNASCPFCIAPTIDRKDGAAFDSGVQYALGLTERINGTVQIVGGEPLISRRLPGLLRQVGQHRLHRVVVNTNGTRMTDDTIKQMVEAGVTHVNISRHHYDEAVNQDIMRLRPHLSNTEIALALSKLTRAGMKVRLQCNLISGGVDSLEGIHRYLAWGIGMGCKSFSLSQLFPLNLFGYQVPIEVGYTESHQVDLVGLVRDFDASPDFRTVGASATQERMSVWGASRWGKYAHPDAKRRVWMGPQDTWVSLKTLSGFDANGVPRKTSYDRSTDRELREGELHFAVVHPDGLVTASWDRRERVLFDATAELHWALNVL